MRRRFAVVATAPLWLAAIAVVAQQMRRAPRPPIAPPGTARELPMPIHSRPPTAGGRYELDARSSSVRFEVTSRFRTISAQADEVEGEIRFDERGEPAAISLQIDLQWLSDQNGAPIDEDARRVLGVDAGEFLRFDGQAAGLRTFGVKGVEKVNWIGRLQLGSGSWRQPVDTWLCTIVPESLRLQGVGTVDTSGLSLPRRYFLGLFAESYTVTLGLDLAFHLTPR